MIVINMNDEPRRNRGRPTVAQKYYGSKAKIMEAIWESGNRFTTKRSTADYIYCTAALRIIKESASEIPYIEELYKAGGQKEWFSRSILSQLGRMSIQDGYSDDDVITIMKIAAKAKHEKHTVKLIELYIKIGRKTGEW